MTSETQAELAVQKVVNSLESAPPISEGPFQPKLLSEEPTVWDRLFCTNGLCLPMATEWLPLLQKHFNHVVISGEDRGTNDCHYFNVVNKSVIVDSTYCQFFDFEKLKQQAPHLSPIFVGTKDRLINLFVAHKICMDHFAKRPDAKDEEVIEWVNQYYPLDPD
jgi:hypothetical protein